MNSTLKITYVLLSFKFLLSIYSGWGWVGGARRSKGCECSYFVELLVEELLIIAFSAMVVLVDIVFKGEI